MNTRSVFAYDHPNKTILGSKTSLKKAGRPNSPESVLLASMMKQYPDYTVKEKEVKKNSSKNVYDGLTMELMKAYIEIQDNSKEMLKIYDRVVEMATKQQKNKKKKYPLTKSWFTSVYKNFDVKKAQEEIDAYWIAKAANPNVAIAQ